MSRIRKMMMEQGMKLMQSETAMKLMQNETFMSLFTRAMMFPGQVRTTVEERVQGFAKMFNLPTQEDIARLRRTVRDLEKTVARLQDEKGANGASHAGDDDAVAAEE